VANNRKIKHNLAKNATSNPTVPARSAITKGCAKSHAPVPTSIIDKLIADLGLNT